MTRYLLDTNIISNVTKPEPSESLLAWMAEQDDEDLFISSLTIGEIWRGVLQTPAGRVLPFDQKAGVVWARLMAEGRAKGRPRSALDTIIAATAEANGCVVVTDNKKDFADVEVINPFVTR